MSRERTNRGLRPLFVHVGTAKARKMATILHTARSTEAIDATVEKALKLSYHDGAGGWDSTGVRWWVRYHMARGEDPFEVAGPEAPFSDKLHDEMRLMRFVTWLAMEKEPTVAVDTASEYGSTVQGWLARNFGVKLGGGNQLPSTALRTC